MQLKGGIKESEDMDTLPDYEIPETPDGYIYQGMRIPKIGDFLVDFYGKAYLITKDNIKYHFENHPIFSKIVSFDVVDD
ncbi:MAG: hypothetical protein AABY22_14780 [Nanoarchaeota archaeon]